MNIHARESGCDRVNNSQWHRAYGFVYQRVNKVQICGKCLKRAHVKYIVTQIICYKNKRRENERGVTVRVGGRDRAGDWKNEWKTQHQEYDKKACPIFQLQWYICSVSADCSVVSDF